MMLRAFLLILSGVSSRVFAFDTSLNPDRWTSVQFNQNATESVDSNQNLSAKGITDDRGLESSVVGLEISLLAPVANEWTVLAGAGASLSHSQTNSLVDSKAGINQPNNTASDNSAVTYQLGFRKYFLGFSRIDKNPDQVPSLGSTFAGSNTIGYGAGYTQNGAGGTLPQNLNVQTYTLTMDFRAPLDDHWTVVPSLAGLYTSSDIPYTAYAAGSSSITRSLSPSAQARYYLVGHNLISKDSRQNPDQWSMLFLTLGGTARIYQGASTISTAGIITPARATNSSSLSAAFGTRLPVTNHMTLTFQIGGAYAESSTPETSTQAGTSTHTPAVDFSAVLKYYYF